MQINLQRPLFKTLTMVLKEPTHENHFEIFLHVINTKALATPPNLPNQISGHVT